ncbi:MAG: sulfite exporter TauE/SafE family protein, partial [Actinomycetes bacterium]
MDAWLLLLSLGAAFGTGYLSAVTGFGGAALLLPVFVWALGIDVAVPLLTVTQVISNASRV